MLIDVVFLRWDEISAERVNMTLLTVSELTVRLKLSRGIFTVVDRLSFSLHPGKTLAIVGESGSGKTMSALSILRILPNPPALPPEGEVLYKGNNLLLLSEKEMRSIRGAKIAMIFQDPMSALNPVFSIAEQLIEVAERHLGLYGKDALEKAIQAMEEVGIPSPRQRLNDYPHQLSGGMKQRVMIAMALMCEPDILIADEPTTALDVTIQAQVLDLIKALQVKRGTAVLLITHDMGVVAEMADDVVVMYATQAVEKGSVFEIFNHLAHPYTQGLFHSIPSYESPQSKLSVIPGSIPPIHHLPSGCYFHPRCPYAMEVCRQGEVPYFSVNDPSHQAKCWLYHESNKQKES